MGMWCRERGEGGAFDGPMVGSVGWSEPLVEEGFLIRFFPWGQPEGGRKGQVDFLEGAVGDVSDGCLETGWKRGLESVGVVL